MLFFWFGGFGLGDRMKNLFRGWVWSGCWLICYSWNGGNNVVVGKQGCEGYGY